MEARIVGASGLPFAAIKAGKFRRLHSAGALAKVANLSTLGPNARDMFRVAQGVISSLRILRQFKPEVVFLKGGYVSLPVGIAARMLGIPYVIHESDLSPGLANRILSRWAEKIAVGFPIKQYRNWPVEKLVFTGNPVRPEILRGDRKAGLMAFDLRDDLPVILVTGGSQGAAQINDIVVAALPELLERYQVIHQTGEGEYERLQFALSRREKLKYSDRYRPAPFILKEMPGVLAAADLVIGRAGAGTIAESAVLGKPTILIPNTEMAGHQVENAKVLARAGAARVINGDRLRPALLVGEIRRILDEPEEQGRLSRAIGQFGRTDAARVLAETILAVGRAGKPNKPEHDETDAAQYEEGSK